MSLDTPIIHIYKEVLCDKRRRFPEGTWSNRSNAIHVIRYLIEDILKWSDEQIRQELNRNIFKMYNLDGMLCHLFDASPYKAINAAYPDRFQPWEMAMSGRSLWSTESGIKATRWLIEEKLKWSESEILSKLKVRVFRQHGLYGMINTVFNNSPYSALDAAYPGKFNKSDFNTKS